MVLLDQLVLQVPEVHLDSLELLVLLDSLDHLDQMDSRDLLDHKDQEDYQEALDSLDLRDQEEQLELLDSKVNLVSLAVLDFKETLVHLDLLATVDPLDSKVGLSSTKFRNDIHRHKKIEWRLEGYFLLAFAHLKFLNVYFDNAPQFFVYKEQVHIAFLFYSRRFLNVKNVCRWAFPGINVRQRVHCIH